MGGGTFIRAAAFTVLGAPLDLLESYKEVSLALMHQ